MRELDRLFGSHMMPLTSAAERLMVQFSRWVVAQLHEMSADTTGLGRVDPDWRLTIFPYGKDMLERELTRDDLAKMIARTFFIRKGAKPRTAADAHLCLILATLAQSVGLIGNFEGMAVNGG